MLKNILFSNVRGVNINKELDKVNFIVGGNGVGKSTIVNGIFNLHKGKKLSNDGIIEITNDDGIILKSIQGKMIDSISMPKEFDLTIPGFFMNNQIKFFNDTEARKRKIISDLLDIDRDEFFKSNGINYELKGLNSKIRELSIKGETLTKEFIEKKEKLQSIKKISKPKEVKLQNSNKSELEKLKSDLEELKERKLIEIPKEPEEVILIKSTYKKGNEEEYLNLKNEILRLKKDGKIKSSNLEEYKKGGICPTCGNAVTLDKNKIKEMENDLNFLREQYAKKEKEFRTFKLIKSKIIDGNTKQYTEYINNLNIYKNSVKQLEDIKEYNNTIKEKRSLLEDKIKKFKLIKDNKEEYTKFSIKKDLYNSYINQKELLEEEIEDLRDKIKSCNSSDLQKKIDNYKEVENIFIQDIQSKLQFNKYVKFIFYKELKTPNSDGDRFIPTFNIEYKGKLYNKCSAGEKGYIDILISKLFLDKYKDSLQIDFILIDNAELSDEKLKKIIKEDLKDYQVLATRIDKGELKIINNI